jgi:hypothetical protein
MTDDDLADVLKLLLVGLEPERRAGYVPRDHARILAKRGARVEGADGKVLVDADMLRELMLAVVERARTIMPSAEADAMLDEVGAMAEELTRPRARH